MATLLPLTGITQSNLKRDYPKVQLKPDFFITQSERMYTVASLNAPADVIVHIISQYYGREAAQHVERNFSHEIRKPYGRSALP